MAQKPSLNIPARLLPTSILHRKNMGTPAHKYGGPNAYSTDQVTVTAIGVELVPEATHVAVILAVPAATPTTTPFASTLAFVESVDDQLNPPG